MIKTQSKRRYSEGMYIKGNENLYCYLIIMMKITSEQLITFVSFNAIPFIISNILIRSSNRD